MKTIKEVFDYLDTINDVYDMRYDNCKMESYASSDNWYKEILKEVLKLEPIPKRIVDVGSNLNQFAYMFVNEGIDYIGIDLWNAGRCMKPLENEHIKFIGANYEDIAEFYKDDVLISNLCVGYVIKQEKVKAKHFIKGTLDKDGKANATKVW